MMTRSKITTLAACVLTLAGVLAARPLADPLVIAAFSEATPGEGLPEAFETLTLEEGTPPTSYTIVRDEEGTPVVKAVSEDAASGIIRRERIDLEAYPVIEWRWKVENVLEKGDVTRKSGDDYPARIYVTFDYDASELGFFDKIKYRALRVMGYDDIPLRALNYLWASRAPVGEIVPNPYTDWVMMLPVESGCARCGTWRTEQRNVYEDYREAFGEEPPAVTGVAIMTDTDNTGERAVAYYGDIRFLPAMPAVPAEE